MHRLLATREELIQEHPHLSREACHHLKVLRPRDGEEIELFDGAGATRIFIYNRAREELVASGDLTCAATRPLASTLFACVTKGSRWDWMVEKVTELGVGRIVPVLSARSIVRIAPDERESKRTRWQRLVKEAARQSDAIWLPEILAPMDFADALQLARETTCFVGALTTPPPQPLLSAVQEEKVHFSVERPPAVFVGPEGDFTAEELAALLAFARPTSFGPTILRAETAAIFAVSVLAASGHQHL